MGVDETGDGVLHEPIARHVWASRYRWRAADGRAEPDIEATRDRVAQALAAVEPADRDAWAARFRALLDDLGFLPGGRIVAGAGTDREVTLFNCFGMGRIDDSMDGIFAALREGALTMQQGGGVGYDLGLEGCTASRPGRRRPPGARARTMPARCMPAPFTRAAVPRPGSCAARTRTRAAT